ncbi:hypothetical protein ACWCQK_28560 [Streptomyces sp. NPDC002306]
MGQMARRTGSSRDHQPCSGRGSHIGCLHRIIAQYGDPPQDLRVRGCRGDPEQPRPLLTIPEGRAAGIDSKTLIKASSISDSSLVGQDDPGDHMTMQTGIDFFGNYGLGLTREQFHSAVIDTVEQMYAKGTGQVKKK